MNNKIEKIAKTSNDSKKNCSKHDRGAKFHENGYPWYSRQEDKIRAIKTII